MTAGMLAAPETQVPAVSCPLESCWPDARRTRGSYWPSRLRADGKVSGIRGSLRTPPRGSCARGLRGFPGTIW